MWNTPEMISLRSHDDSWLTTRQKIGVLCEDQCVSWAAVFGSEGSFSSRNFRSRSNQAQNLKLVENPNPQTCTTKVCAALWNDSYTCFLCASARHAVCLLFRGEVKFLFWLMEYVNHKMTFLNVWKAVQLFSKTLPLPLLKTKTIWEPTTISYLILWNIK